jgi:hypothetical protein
MSMRTAAALAIWALGLALSGCSLAGPGNHTFLTASGQPIPAARAPTATATPVQTAAATPVQTAAAPQAKAPKAAKHKSKNKGTAVAQATPKSNDPAAVFDAASRDCKETTRDKGIKSVLAILSHMRPGAVDADYVACMKEKGYEVAK